MYLSAIFLAMMAYMIGITQVLSANMTKPFLVKQSEVRAYNLKEYFQGALTYATNNAGFTGAVTAANVTANLPTWYAQNGPTAWTAQVRTYGSQRIVIASGTIGNTGAAMIQTDTRSPSCGFIRNGGFMAPRPGGSGPVTLGPASTTPVNFNNTPYFIADGQFACVRVIN